MWHKCCADIQIRFMNEKEVCEVFLFRWVKVKLRLDYGYRAVLREKDDDSRVKKTL